jgi:hypothetical protein
VSSGITEAERLKRVQFLFLPWPPQLSLGDGCNTFACDNMTRMGSSPMSRKDHWERVFSTKGAAEVSWFQPEPSRSLEMLDRTGFTAET